VRPRLARFCRGWLPRSTICRAAVQQKTCFTSPRSRSFRLRLLPDRPLFIHVCGVLLFLFIPLVLFLLLRFPFGILSSFALAIFLMLSHRFIAIPFMNRYRSSRCFWCGRTSRTRTSLTVQAAGPINFQFCESSCLSLARRFFDLCLRYRMLFRIGIFIPLAWYVVTMLLIGLGWFSFSIEWNRFVFQFFIAVTVVSISFFYRNGNETVKPAFPFPIHNLFLLGARNTLLVFRYVGLWWIAMSLWFLWKKN